MGSFIPFADDQPFEEKVKSLADDELLDIWTQSQQIENIVSSRLSSSFSMPLDYERVIINELSFRACQRKQMLR